MKISEYLPMLKGIQKVSEQTRSILKITRGNNSNETEGRVTILFSVHQLMMLHICTIFYKKKNILNSYKVLEWLQMPY